jgi:hypothetical protein
MSIQELIVQSIVLDVEPEVLIKNNLSSHEAVNTINQDKTKIKKNKTPKYLTSTLTQLNRSVESLSKSKSNNNNNNYYNNYKVSSDTSTLDLDLFNNTFNNKNKLIDTIVVNKTNKTFDEIIKEESNSRNSRPTSAGGFFKQLSFTKPQPRPKYDNSLYPLSKKKTKNITIDIDIINNNNNNTNNVGLNYCKTANNTSTIANNITNVNFVHNNNIDIVDTLNNDLVMNDDVDDDYIKVYKSKKPLHISLPPSPKQRPQSAKFLRNELKYKNNNKLKSRSKSKSSLKKVDIHLLADKDDIELLEEELNKNPFRLEERDVFNMTPYLCACRRGKSNTIRWFLSRGCDMYAKDLLGRDGRALACDKKTGKLSIELSCLFEVWTGVINVNHGYNGPLNLASNIDARCAEDAMTSYILDREFDSLIYDENVKNDQIEFLEANIEVPKHTNLSTILDTMPGHGSFEDSQGNSPLFSPCGYIIEETSSLVDELNSITTNINSDFEFKVINL